MLAGVQDETLAAAALIGISVLTYALFVVIYGYLSLTVPALATESKNAPGWIGKPAKATNPLTAFERSVRLVGKQNIVRIGLVYGGLVLICLAVIGLVAAGVVLMIALYARALNADVLTVLENGWTIFGVVAFSRPGGDVGPARVRGRRADPGLPRPADAPRGPRPGHAVRLRAHPPAVRPAAGLPSVGPAGARRRRRDDPDPAAAGGPGPDRPGRGPAPGR